MDPHHCFRRHRGCDRRLGAVVFATRHHAAFRMVRLPKLQRPGGLPETSANPVTRLILHRAGVSVVRPPYFFMLIAPDYESKILIDVADRLPPTGIMSADDRAKLQTHLRER